MGILDDAHVLRSEVDSEIGECEGQIHAVISHTETMQSRINEHQGMYNSTNLEAASAELMAARDKAEELLSHFAATREHIDQFVNSVMQ